MRLPVTRSLLLLALLLGCEPLEQISLEDRIPPVAVQLDIAPNSATPGEPRFVEITGFGADWAEGQVSVDLGADVQAFPSRVEGHWMRVQVVIATEAELGRRDLTVRWAGRTEILRDAFIVEPGAFTVTPNRVSLGDAVEVEIRGVNTQFTADRTVISVDEDVEVLEWTVIDPERIVARLHVSERANVGYHDVWVYNPGAQVYTLKRGLMVDRSRRHMSITPNEGDQGQTVLVKVKVDGAKLEPNSTTIDLGTGVLTEWLEVLDPETFEAELRLGNNAAVGPRDVVVRSTPPLGDPENRILVDGFTIRPVDANPLRARVSLSFSISNVWNYDSCAWNRRVSASALFYEPNDFPCPPSGASSTLSVPPHFDLAGTGFSFNPGGSTDCPSPKTFDAGPEVWFVGEQNVISLERFVTDFTGRVSYRALNLSVDDYITDAIYDLETAGGDLGFSELPSWKIEDALFTLPVVYDQTEPDYCGLVHPIDEPLDVVWDAAGTYDQAEMYLYMMGPAQDDGVPIMMVYPWDDGEFTYEPEVLDFFTDGGVVLLQSAFRQNRFDVPESEFVNAGFANSAILFRGAFELE